MSMEYQLDQGSMPLITEVTTNPQTTTAPSQRQTTTAQTNRQIFPVRTLKVFGGVQIGIGTLIGILSLIAVIVDSVAMHKECKRVNYDQQDWYHRSWRCLAISRRNNQLFAFDVTCLISSGWYLLTGFLPLCMSRKRQDSWRGLRVGFMVCCIIGASVFVPIMVTLGVIGCIKRNRYDSGFVVLSAFIVVLSLAEMIVAIIAASYCCCCTPWSTNQAVTVLYMNAAQPGVVVNPHQNQIPVMPFQPNVVQGAGATFNTTAQYPTIQQYMITTGQRSPQDLQTVGTLQPSAVDLPQVVNGPPAYKA